MSSNVGLEQPVPAGQEPEPGGVVLDPAPMAEDTAPTGLGDHAGLSEAERRRLVQAKIAAQVRMAAGFWALRYKGGEERRRFEQEYVERVTGVLEWVGWEDVNLVTMDPRRLPYGVRVGIGLAALVGGGLFIGPDGLRWPWGQDGAVGLDQEDGGAMVHERHESGGAPGSAHSIVDAVPDEA